jgi:hypothetical protein
VLRVRGPAERVHPCAVEGPAGGDQLALGHVVQDDLPAGLETDENTSANIHTCARGGGKQSIR